MTDVVIKSKETKTGVNFRILRDNKYYFTELPFKNYFYIKTSDFNVLEKDLFANFQYAIDGTETIGQFTKIILSSNWMRNKIKKYLEETCKTYEADITANKRFLLDVKVELNNTLIPYTFYDIETDDRLPLVKDDRGNVIPKARILSFAAVDQNKNVFYLELNSETDDDERALLTMIVKYFSNYGIISGWNSEKFDMPYIKGRCDALGVQYQILDYVNHLDYEELFKKYDKKSRDNYKLNYIAGEVTGEHKLDQEKGEGKIYQTWLNDKDHLREYNIQDCELLRLINEKMMFIEVSMKRADRAVCHVRSTMNNSDSGDYLLMRAYKAADIIMPSKPNEQETARRKALGSIGGGYTTCFSPGFYEKVHVWDFKSEYPSAIQTWNIDPLTYVETIHDETVAAQIDRTKFIITPSDFEGGVYHPARVYKKEEGVIPKVVRGLVEDRDVIKYTMDKYKDEFLEDGSPNPDYDPEKYKQQYLEQYAIKTDGNSIYGILAFPLSRYYSFDLGDSVTTCARATLKACNVAVEDWGGHVIGGDTDSSFVILEGSHTEKEIDDKYVEFLQKWADSFGCVNNKLVFEHEKILEKMLFAKKKNYAYIMNGKITIKGLEAIKSDANRTGAEMQKKFIQEVLTGTYDVDKWETEIEALYNRVMDQELTADELILTKALSKMPKEYEGYVIDKKTRKPKVKRDGTLQKKSIPAHVKLADRQLQAGVDLYPGSKIKFIVIAIKPNLVISKEDFLKGEGKFEHKNKKGEYILEWEGGYEANYYWKRIIKPIFKVVKTYHDVLPDWNWKLTPSEMRKLIDAKEEDEDED